ncbi:hypothetical protein FPZ12_018080 [Amycolatopsis acidicola]|uniref:Uncharacterized protein n=1 Tax=Amycolatopsis acidicola TaxID=2596893 RepID=A0A5N0V377_9PSEU|nr:hypothetical protein [Amycolatopsis acidicola]KAA9160254.1 hypothetical protein FPZ12_018080 [Amycolatopsis acidicola]
MTTLFTAQVDQEIADLEQVSETLSSVVAAHGLSREVLDRFALLIRRQHGELERIKDAQDGWAALERLRPSIVEIEREALSFTQGVLLRESGLDHGIGEIAERLLEHLVRQTGLDRGVLFSLAENQFISHTVGMVRGRFPDVGVWNLPVLAHELGHHVALVLRHSDPRWPPGAVPVLDYLGEEADTADDPERELAYLHELFADVYATYVMGPAYPYCFMTLAARPDRVAAPSRTHPSWGRRVWTIMAAFSALGAGHDTAAAGYRALVGDIRTLANKAAEPLEPEERVLAASQAAAMVELLAEHALPQARYAIPGRIRAIPIDEERADLPDPATTIVDVVNAAWRWRRRDRENWVLDRASRRALRLCTKAKE